MKIDEDILLIDKNICANIGNFDFDKRGLQSQNILSQLRNLVEHTALKVYGKGKDIDNNYDNIKLAIEYIKTRGELRFLSRFHKFLQITTSHYTLDEENSERLMLKYYEYLLKLKSFLQKSYKLDILKNIEEFPIKIDESLKIYYEKIAEKINEIIPLDKRNKYSDRYYIQRIKSFFVEKEVYYEITLSPASDRASKFDRVIAFTKLDITPNYAVKLTLSNNSINVLNKTMPIILIDDWEVSIRPCELTNYAKIFGENLNQSRTKEYLGLMDYLKSTGLNLSEIIELSDVTYNNFKNEVSKPGYAESIINLLDKSRGIIKNNRSGCNVLKYLLFRLNNITIKKQYSLEVCPKLSNLKLQQGCIPFDQMPLATALINHNPRIGDILDCFDSTHREHELFARFINNNTEIKGHLYTLNSEVDGFNNIDNLITDFNKKVYYRHTNRYLEEFKNCTYIKGYEEDTIDIIKRIKELTLKGIKNYSASFDSWLNMSSYNIDCSEKKEKLRLMFENSEVALIYGSAGTGKSTLINHISNFFNSRSKLFLANTNPAIDNLKRRVNAANCTFMTITKFLLSSNSIKDYDLLIIDECSTVSNLNMIKVLKKASFKLLVLVGDVYQIESIRFGNWFGLAREFVPDTSVFELTKPYRSHNDKLLELWSRVRNIDDNILEHIAKNNYSHTLDESIFDHSQDDEIILCLNYDGLYGINNINRFLQENNKNKEYHWGIQVYKVNDPILFNESERFAPLIYNNLKGKIVDIELHEDKIRFDIELDKTINEFDAFSYDFELRENAKNGNSIIRFYVSKIGNSDNDDDYSSSSIVPFQVAYAVSIHKAQGLEYDSVKIVITDEAEEMITHNIFYTAITRAKDKLKIYWSPEVENRILKSLKKRNTQKDKALLTLRLKS